MDLLLLSALQKDLESLTGIRKPLLYTLRRYIKKHTENLIQARKNDCWLTFFHPFSSNIKAKYDCGAHSLLHCHKWTHLPWWLDSMYVLLPCSPVLWFTTPFYSLISKHTISYSWRISDSMNASLSENTMLGTYLAPRLMSLAEFWMFLVMGWSTWHQTCQDAPFSK